MTHLKRKNVLIRVLVNMSLYPLFKLLMMVKRDMNIPQNEVIKVIRVH